MNFLRNSRFLRSLCFKTAINDRSSFVSLQLLNLKRGAIPRCGGVQTHFLSTMVDTSELECDELVDGSKAKEKDNALHVAIRQLASEFGRESMLSLSNFFNPRCSAVISTGSLKLDHALGVGGLPKGRIVEIYGKEASGKTTLALHVIKEAQKLGGYCAYLDAENAMDPTLAESIGVNTENLLISCPDSAENMLCVVDKLAKSGSLDVIVVDSVAALIPQCEIDGDIAAAEHGGVLSKVMTKALRRIHSSLCRSKTLIIFLNQVRYNPKSNKGLGQKGEVTCGGNALGFYAAVRMRISRTGLLSTSDKMSKINGIGICVQVLKNKMAPPMTSAQLGIKFGRGIQLESEVLELGIQHGLILKEGNSYFIEGEVFDSAQAGERFLAENEVVLDKLVMDLRTELFEKSS